MGDGHTCVGHAGHETGYIAAAFFDPQSKSDIVYVQNFDDAGKEVDLDRVVLKRKRSIVRTLQLAGRGIELCSEFFHCCIVAGNFTSFSTVQSYLCGN